MKPEENYAITVEDLVKIYKIYQNPPDRLKEALSPTHKRYSTDFYALKNISFKVNRGEIYGIMGKNGSGKSTLLKIITGVLNETQGNIQINGKVSALLELGAGFNSEYTGMENIFLNGMMIGFTREEMEGKLESIISFADIGDYINQPVKTYSSGMFARLAFAVSINVDPDILIVDEALSVGDYFFQAKCYKKFEEFRNNGKTILFVSHDMSSILKYCDRVLLLNNGEQIAEGSAGEIVDIYKKIMTSTPMDSNSLPEKSYEVIEEPTSEMKKALTVNPKANEYGNFKAEILDFGIIDYQGKINSSLLKNSTFKISMIVKFNEDITDPIFAFTIRDIKGTDLIGTNTMLENKIIGHVKAGEIMSCTFTQEIHLQGGTYLLSLGCTGYDSDEFVVYHRLYDVCSIDIVSDKNTIGFYDCGSEIQIEKLKKEKK